MSTEPMECDVLVFGYRAGRDIAAFGAQWHVPEATGAASGNAPSA
jgi:hypothetical protein